MPDDLDVSGGSTAIATEDLDCAAEQLSRLSTEAGALAAELSRLEPPPTPGTMYGDQARVDIDLAADGLHEVARSAAFLASTLTTAAQGYIVGERVVGTVVRGVEMFLAYWIGAQAPGWVLRAGPMAGLVGGLWAGIRATGGLDGVFDKPFEKGGIPKASPFVKEHNYLINNAVSVGVIRTLAQSAGPFVLGMAGAPPWVPQIPGTGSFETGAKGVIALGRSLDLFEETSVTLVETKQLPVVAPPRDYVDRLARVPYADDGSGPQVMIEKYAVPGKPDRFAVYIGGTATFSPVATTEPWDMTSNMFNAAGAESGSVASVRLAMQAAGVDENSPVQFTGYSQGGGTAARLAASGMYNTQGLTTFGGPTGQVPLPDGFPTVLVEHSDDPVPALGGEQDNANAVLVRRDVFGGQDVPQAYAVPSHHIEWYLQTARLMDESGSPQLDSTMARLDDFTAGATLQSSTAYTFERTED